MKQTTDHTPSHAAPSAPDSLEQLRVQYARDRGRWIGSLLAPTMGRRGVRLVLQHLSDLADTLLRALWHRAGMPPEACLAAVGGFGRAQLFPYSDIDVLVLLPAAGTADAELASRIEKFIGSCWDAGLEIGSSVRTLAECLEESERDLTVQTALLESRRICGSEPLFAEFQTRYQAQMNAHAFLSGKLLEMRQRHNKYESTPYSLEPNCKESPGGLRDLHTMIWLARAASFTALLSLTVKLIRV